MGQVGPVWDFVGGSGGVRGSWGGGAVLGDRFVGVGSGRGGPVGEWGEKDVGAGFLVVAWEGGEEVEGAELVEGAATGFVGEVGECGEGF